MDTWTSLLEIAIHLPSPHNVQPWRVRLVSADEAELFIDKARTLPNEDVTGSFIILTMGMFLEGLGLLAANRGLRLEQTPSQEASRFTTEAIAGTRETMLPFARLRLVRDATVRATFPDELFLRRQTSRIALRSTPVPEEATRALSGLAQEWGQRYEAIADPARIERILEWNAEAVFDDMNAPEYHDEIVSWFRFTDRAARRHRDGLDYRCMNTSRSEFFLVARLPRLLQLPLARPMLLKRYNGQIGRVPTIGLLAGGFWRPEDALRTGRFLIRFWLETARQGLYIHPYGNLVTNKKANARMLQETGLRDIWLVFKIGHSDPPPRSHRRPVEQILLV
jgi:nitroreductase